MFENSEQTNKAIKELDEELDRLTPQQLEDFFKPCDNDLFLMFKHSGWIDDFSE